MSHANAPLTVEGRRRLCLRVDAGRPIAHVAAEAGIARATLGKWYARWRAHGQVGLHDRPSRPLHSPYRTPPQVQARIEELRRNDKLGPVTIAGRLAAEGVTIAASTVHRVLVRLGISRLRDLDPGGAEQRRAARASRYEHAAPGDLVHLDVKKLGRIPDGGGWRAHGRGSAQHKASKRRRVGYVYLHSAVDDHTRLAYTEELPDEKGATAAAFWARAVRFFRAHGIRRIARVLTDNGACYRSMLFNAALAKTRTRHKWTRPYRPQTNGKVERFHRTLAREWAYARSWASNDERAAALTAWIQTYNYARPHTALGGRPPVSRCPGVNNLAA